MTHSVYLIAEGVHDVAFLGKLLRERFKLKQIRRRDQLDPAWARLLDGIKSAYLAENADTDISRLSLPAPMFFSNSMMTVAVCAAGGLSELVKRLRNDFQRMLRVKLQPEAVGLFLDNDAAPPSERFENLLAELKQMGLPLPERLGQVTQTSPHVGVFSMPNPSSQGTLEDLLLDCAEHVYPSMLREAKQLVERREEFLGELEKDERSDLAKPSGTKKATVAVMGAFLKPGKAIQTSIQDHRWVSEQTINQPALASLNTFLEELLAQSPSIEPLDSNLTLPTH